MSKVIKKFQFDLPLTHKSTINGVLKSRQIGNLTVTGVGYENTNVPRVVSEPDEGDRFEFDFNSIMWNGIDVMDLLQYKCEDLMSEISYAAYNHLSTLFEPETIE